MNPVRREMTTDSVGYNIWTFPYRISRSMQSRQAGNLLLSRKTL